MTKRLRLIKMASVIVVLLVIRALAPLYIEQQINRTIAQTDGIQGGVFDVDLHLYRGAYTIKGIELYAVKGLQVRPLLAIPELEFTLAWGVLLLGQLATEMILHKPEINLIDRSGVSFADENGLTSAQTWLGLSDSLAPFTINQLTVKSGKLHLYLGDGEDRNALTLARINGQIKSLSNTKKGELASFNANAVLYGESNLVINGNFDPNTQAPSFDVDLTLDEIAVSQFDTLIDFYSPFDVEAGTAKLAIEMKSQEGQVDGYARLGIKDFSLFSFEQDALEDGDNPIKLLAEGLTQLVASALENNNTGLIATRASLSGNINKVDTPLLPAIWGLIENAFIRAYTIDIERSVKFSGKDATIDKSKTVPKSVKPVS